MSVSVFRQNGLTTIVCRQRRPRKCSLCTWSCVAYCDGPDCNVALCSRHRWAANDKLDFCPPCQGDLMRAARSAPAQASLF
jgi:hypothetical protein